MEQPICSSSVLGKSPPSPGVATPEPTEAKKGVGPPPGFSNTNLQNKSGSGSGAFNLGQPSSAGGLLLGSLSTGSYMIVRC